MAGSVGTDSDRIQRADLTAEARGGGLGRIVRSVVVAGTVASVATGVTLAALARAEGKGALQPLNATSHWLHGPDAGRARGLDVHHTGAGYLTHHASCIFWALPLEWWLASRTRLTVPEVVGAAGVVSGIAALVDYGIVPRRITPGWELAVSPRSISATFVAMALGLAAGSLLAQGIHRRPDRHDRGGA